MLYLVSDHAGFDLKEGLQKFLMKDGIEFVDLTASYDAGDDYPQAAQILANKLDTKNISKEQTELGLAICGTGQGMAISLNKFPHIRAGLALNTTLARLMREHNNANALCLPGQYLSLIEASEIVKVFLTTPFSQEPRHIRRVEEINNLPLSSFDLA